MRCLRYLERVWFLLLGQQTRISGCGLTSRELGDMRDGGQRGRRQCQTQWAPDRRRCRAPAPCTEEGPSRVPPAPGCRSHVLSTRRGLAVNPQGAEGANAPLSGARAWGVKRAEPAAPFSLPTYEWPWPDDREGGSLMIPQGRPWPGFLLLCNPSPPHPKNPPGDPSLQLLEAGLHSPCPQAPRRLPHSPWCSSLHSYPGGSHTPAGRRARPPQSQHAPSPLTLGAPQSTLPSPEMTSGPPASPLPLVPSFSRAHLWAQGLLTAPAAARNPSPTLTSLTTSMRPEPSRGEIITGPMSPREARATEAVG